jgi:hypothetical protein
MPDAKHELKFLELVRKGNFTVFENGDIYRIKCRLCNSKCFIKINIYINKEDYCQMRFSYEKKRYMAQVHRVVYCFFHGEIPDGMQINHKDGNKKNNAISNLEMVTPKENILHAIYVTKKFKCFGFKNLKSRLQPTDIGKILYYRKLCGFSSTKLAERFGVSRSQIWRICKFTTWRDLIDRKDEKYQQLEMARLNSLD